MKFQIHAAEGMIDHVAIARALQAIDASVMIKIDPFEGRLRIAGQIEEDEAIQALRGIGYRIEPIGGECCGGCGCG